MYATTQLAGIQMMSDKMMTVPTILARMNITANNSTRKSPTIY